jgi:HEAT repeat protein
MTRGIATMLFGALMAAPFAHAQTAGTARTSSTTAAPSSARALADGWAALAAGRPGDAETSADALLSAGRARHDAATLKIHARIQAGRPDGALDSYEQWMQSVGREDVFLLQPIARGVLDALTRSQDAGVKLKALEVLAASGDADAAARLSAMSSAQGAADTDDTLARLGNAKAIARLQQRVSNPGARGDVSDAIEALVKAKATGAIPAIAGALDPARPMPTKLAAARALGQLDARDAIPQLRQALRDPDPSVRMMAAASLSRLGDQSGSEILQQMENSPLADVRLMLAEIAAPQNPAGTWVASATKALEDPDPLVRLSAAELLVKYAADPAPGLLVLTGALADPNPAMRVAASWTVEEIPIQLLGNDLPSLRRWLRDATPQVRIAAAAALLRLAGGVE